MARRSIELRRAGRRLHSKYMELLAERNRLWAANAMLRSQNAPHEAAALIDALVERGYIEAWRASRATECLLARATRTCAREECGKPLPSGSAAQRKYCTKRCQVAQWRLDNAVQAGDVS